MYWCEFCYLTGATRWPRPCTYLITSPPFILRRGMGSGLASQTSLTTMPPIGWEQCWCLFTYLRKKQRNYCKKSKNYDSVMKLGRIVYTHVHLALCRQNCPQQPWTPPALTCNICWPSWTSPWEVGEDIHDLRSMSACITRHDIKICCSKAISAFFPTAKEEARITTMQRSRWDFFQNFLEQVFTCTKTIMLVWAIVEVFANTKGHVCR